MKVLSRPFAWRGHKMNEFIPYPICRHSTVSALFIVLLPKPYLHAKGSTVYM